MKQTLVRWLAIGAAIAGLTASAAVRPGRGSVSRLVYDAEELDRQIHYSNLNGAVKQASYDFLGDVYRLDRCVGMFRPGGVPPYCQQDLLDTRSSFSLVSRYLRPLQQQYPQIHRQWSYTAATLRDLSMNPGPGPAPHTYSCVAVDAGWEEHFGGHVGYGRTIAQAQQQAIAECRRFHGQCRIRSCQ